MSAPRRRAPPPAPRAAKPRVANSPAPSRDFFVPPPLTAADLREIEAERARQERIRQDIERVRQELIEERRRENAVAQLARAAQLAGGLSERDRVPSHVLSPCFSVSLSIYLCFFLPLFLLSSFSLLSSPPLLSSFSRSRTTSPLTSLSSYTVGSCSQQS